MEVRQVPHTLLGESLLLADRAKGASENEAVEVGARHRVKVGLTHPLSTYYALYDSTVLFAHFTLLS